MGYPWEGTLGSENEPDGMTTDALTMIEGTFIFHGEYDAQVFVDEYAEGFDDREVNRFTVLEGRPGEDTENFAYAVDDAAVVVAISSTEDDAHEEIVANLDEALDNRIDQVGRVVDFRVFSTGEQNRNVNWNLWRQQPHKTIMLPLR